MRLNPETKHFVSRVAAITIAWLLIFWFLFFYDAMLLHGDMSLGPSAIYSMPLFFIFYTFLGSMGGLFGGISLVFVNDWVFRRKPFRYGLIVTAMTYLFAFPVITLLAGGAFFWIRDGGNAGPWEIFRTTIEEFKAGLHSGSVTAGEIGSIKRDIVYSGDVLNTTARIQEQCNQYQVNFLTSRETFDLFGDQQGFEPVPLGEIVLRGKQEIINLNTIRWENN